MLALATATILGGCACTEAREQAGDCFGGLLSRLRAGGYSGSVDCDAIEVRVEHIGDISTGNAQYEIFSLTYFQKHPAADSRHGGQRILVFARGSHYVGQYVLDTPPFFSPRVVSKSIIFDLPPRQGNEIRFDAGPPAETYINENTLALVK